MASRLTDICRKTPTKSHRHPYGIRSDGGRNLIGRRTESDWTANANGGKSLKKIRNTCCAGIADKGLFYCASIINILLQKDVT